MIVVETELIAGLYLPTELTPISERVFEKDPYWLAPFIWRSEFMRAVSIYVSKGLLTLNKAAEAVELAEIQMKNRDYRPVAFDVLEKSSQSGLNVRDCEFVSLASFTGIRLVTVDERIIRQFPEIGIHPDEFSPVPG